MTLDPALVTAFLSGVACGVAIDRFVLPPVIRGWLCFIRRRDVDVA